MTMPSVGRVVHYAAPDGECVAAIVSRIQDETLITLTTFPVTGPNVVASVPEDGMNSSDTWHWPERV